jgi:hypothetical protein
VGYKRNYRKLKGENLYKKCLTLYLSDGELGGNVGLVKQGLGGVVRSKIDGPK